MRGWCRCREETEKISQETECKSRNFKKYMAKKRGGSGEDRETVQQGQCVNNKVCKIVQVTARPDYFA